MEPVGRQALQARKLSHLSVHIYPKFAKQVTNKIRVRRIHWDEGRMLW